MRLRYLVQLADHYGFDFGGENHGGVATFVAKGDAIAFAMELRRRANKEARVIDTSVRDVLGNRAEIFLAHVLSA